MWKRKKKHLKRFLKKENSLFVLYFLSQIFFFGVLRDLREEKRDSVTYFHQVHQIIHIWWNHEVYPPSSPMRKCWYCWEENALWVVNFVVFLQHSTVNNDGENRLTSAPSTVKIISSLLDRLIWLMRKQCCERNMTVKLGKIQFLIINTQA